MNISIMEEITSKNQLLVIDNEDGRFQSVDIQNDEKGLYFIFKYKRFNVVLEEGLYGNKRFQIINPKG